MAIIEMTTSEFNNKYLTGEHSVGLTTPPTTTDDTGFFEDFSNSIGAAFELENTVGSFLSSDSFSVDNDVEEGYDVFNDISGYEEYAGNFIGVRNSNRTQAIKKDIDDEKAKRQIVADAGLGGFAASVVASVFDPVDWAIALGTGGIGVVNKAGKMAKIANGAIQATTATVGVEAALHSTQQTRTLEESLISAVTAPAMVGIVNGASVALKMSGKFGAPSQKALDDAGEEVVESMTSGKNWNAVPSTDDLSPRSIGAAETQLDGFGGRQATVLAKEHWTRANQFNNLDESYGKKFFGAINKTQMYLTPIGRLAGSVSENSRKYIHGFLENGLVTKGAVAGEAKDIAVETTINRIQGQLNAAAYEVESNFVKAKEDGSFSGNDSEFFNEVGKAMSNGDTHRNPHVQKAAEDYRIVLDKLKDEAVNVGLLPKDLETVTGAQSYFTRVYDKESIRKDRTQFETLLTNHFEEAAVQTKAKGSGTLNTLNSKNLGLTEDEFMAGKPNKPDTRKQIKAYIDAKVHAKWVERRENLLREELGVDLSELTPEETLKLISKPKAKKVYNTDSAKVKDKFKEEAINELYADLKDSVKDTPEYLEIITHNEKSFLKSKNNKSKEEQLVENLLELKRESGADANTNTDVGVLRESAKRATYNILGQGNFVPSTFDAGAGFSKNVANQFKKRVLTISDAELEPYLLKDARSVIRRNIQTLTPQIQIMKKQKQLADLDGNFVITKRGGGEELIAPDLEMTGLINKVRNDYEEKLYMLDSNTISDAIMDGKFTGNSDSISNVIGSKVYDDMKKSVLTPLVENNILVKVDEGFKVAPNVTKEQIDSVLINNKDMNKVINKWSDKYVAQRDQDIKDIEATRDLLLGRQRYKSEPERWWNVSMRNLGMLNYMSMLGGVVISSVTDIARHGMVNGLRGFLQVFKKNSWKTYVRSISKQEARRLGVVIEIIENKRAAELASIEEGIHDVGWTEKTLGKLSNGFSKYNGSVYWNDFNKNVAVASTQDIILEMSERYSIVLSKQNKMVSDFSVSVNLSEQTIKSLLNKRSLSKSDKKVLESSNISLEVFNTFVKSYDEVNTLTKDERVRLAESGLTLEDLNLINIQYKKYGESEDGLRLGMASKWDDVELADKYSDVLRKQADMAVISPSKGDKPLWATSSEFTKAMFQFSSFIFAATNRQSLANGSYKAKSMIPWLGLQLSLGYFITDLKDTIAGKDDRDWDGEFTQNALEVVDRSGVIPLFSYFSKAGQAFGITSRGRYEESNALGSLLGPSYGRVDDMRQVVVDIFDGKGGEAIDGISRMTPYQNHFAVQMVETLGMEREEILGTE